MNPLNTILNEKAEFSSRPVNFVDSSHAKLSGLNSSWMPFGWDCKERTWTWEELPNQPCEQNILTEFFKIT